MATGSPWKFPPERSTKESANTIGLSVALFISISMVRRTKARVSRDGSVNLGRAAEGVRVLNPAAIAMRLAQGAAGQKPLEIPGGGGLAFVRTSRMDPRIERDVGPKQRVHGHGRHHVGGSGQGLGLEQSEAGDAGHELRAVDQGQAFLGPEGDRLRGQPSGRASAAFMARPLNSQSPSPMSRSAT